MTATKDETPPTTGQFWQTCVFEDDMRDRPGFIDHVKEDLERKVSCRLMRVLADGRLRTVVVHPWREEEDRRDPPGPRRRVTLYREVTVRLFRWEDAQPGETVDWDGIHRDNVDRLEGMGAVMPNGWVFLACEPRHWQRIV